jgi:uncharacterized protein (DUF1015 family)
MKGTFNSSDPVVSLDASILQNNLLGPILGIADPRTDKRIDVMPPKSTWFEPKLRSGLFIHKLD